MMETKPISDVPKEAMNLLYENRIKTPHHDPTYEDVTGAYEFIVVDNVVYCTDADSLRVKEYFQEDRTYTKGMLPDAIIYHGLLLKNRYGYTRF